MAVVSANTQNIERTMRFPFIYKGWKMTMKFKDNYLVFMQKCYYICHNNVKYNLKQQKDENWNSKGD